MNNKRITAHAKNGIARKLTIYFALCLLVFSVIIGSIFMILFRRHTIDVLKSDLHKRAAEIAQTLSGYFDGTTEGGYGAYMRFLDSMETTDVWIVDRNFEVITRGHGHHGNTITYNDLPVDADHVIDEVFAGKTAFSESFSEVLNRSTITVGTPIESDGTVVGVVLLHSPIDDTNAAVQQGLMMLGISIAVALLLAMLLSLWLSKSFTDPIVSKEAAEALRLEKLRRDFVANISHELKTPVAVLRGSLEALNDEVVTEPDEVKAYHKEMLNETIYLQRLVGDLLDLSRLQNTDFAVDKQKLDFCDLLTDAVHTIKHIADEKSIELVLRLSPPQQAAIYYGDYGRLRQMLLIILDNAVKFSPLGGIVDIALDGHTVTIRDHGNGIAADELPFLFERFYKSRSEINRSGTGLGLAIAKQIAERHGIAITARNAASGGALFELILK